MAVRSVAKGREAAEQVYRDVPTFHGLVTVYELDMASFDSVRAFAERVKTELTKVDILILNAGLAAISWRCTRDGWEETIQVNVLSTGLLALLLLPKLSNTSRKPHLVIVTSDSAFFVTLDDGCALTVSCVLISTLLGSFPAS